MSNANDDHDVPLPPPIDEEAEPENQTPTSVRQKKEFAASREGNKKYHQYRKDVASKVTTNQTSKYNDTTRKLQAGEAIPMLQETIQYIQKLCGNEQVENDDHAALFFVEHARPKFGRAGSGSSAEEQQSSALITELAAASVVFSKALYMDAQDGLGDDDDDDVLEGVSESTAVANILFPDINLSSTIRKCCEWVVSESASLPTTPWTLQDEKVVIKKMQGLSTQFPCEKQLNCALLVVAAGMKPGTHDATSVGAPITRVYEAIASIANTEVANDLISKTHIRCCKDIVNMVQHGNDPTRAIKRIVQFAHSKTASNTKSSLHRLWMLAAAYECVVTHSISIEKAWEAATHVSFALANRSKLTFHASVRNYTPANKLKALAASHSSLHQLLDNRLSKHVTLFDNAKKKLQVSELFQLLEVDLGLSLQKSSARNAANTNANANANANVIVGVGNATNAKVQQLESRNIKLQQEVVRLQHRCKAIETKSAAQHTQDQLIITKLQAVVEKQRPQQSVPTTTTRVSKRAKTNHATS